MLEKRSKLYDVCVYGVFYLLVHFLGAEALLAQSSDLHVLWTKKEGLSSNLVYCVVKGKDGFLWIGTGDGLNRFDGETFEIFKHTGDSNSIQSNAPNKLLFTQDQKLVIAFIGGGVSLFDPEKNEFKNFLPGEKNLPQWSVEKIYETSSGELWFAVQNHGVFRLNKDGFEHLFDLPDLNVSGLDSVYNKVHDIYEVDDTMWLATANGLYTMPKGEIKPIRIPYGNDKDKYYGVGNITYDLKSKFWMGSWTLGLFSYDLKTKEWGRYTYAKACKEHCFTNIVEDVEIISEDELILATLDQGLVKFKISTKKFQVESPGYSKYVPSPFGANNILVDKNKDTWVSTDKGLLQCSRLKNVLNNLDSSAKKSSEFYYDRKHNIMLITTRFSDGLHIHDYQEKIDRVVSVPIPEIVKDKTQMIVSIAQRTNGDIYILSKECLWTLDIRSWKLKPVKLKRFMNLYKASLNGALTKMLHDSDNNLWIANDWSPVVLKLDSKDSITEITNNFPARFATETSNQIWFGSKMGLSVYSKRTSQIVNKWNAVEIKGLELGANIHDLCTIRDTVWVATSLGLFQAEILNNGKLLFKPQNEDFGLSYSSFHNLISDDQGNLWFTLYNRGIGKLQPNKNVSIFPFTDSKGNDLSVESTSFQRLSSSEINGHNAIIIGTADGAYWFNPDSVTVSKELPIFSIKESTIPGRILDSDIEIPNRQSGEIKGNTLNILFNLVYFKDVKKIRYAYRLKQLNPQWKFGDSKNRYINQNDLPNDKPITLEIKVCNEYNVWSKPLHITFQIDSPIWQRAWFIWSSIILLSIFVWGIVKVRVGIEKKRADDRLELVSRIHNYEIEVQKEQLELKRKIFSSEIKALRSQMNPHFIFNCLSTIQDQVFAGQSTEATKYIADFGLLLRKTLNNSDRPLIKLKEEISMIELYIKMEALRFKDQFAWEIKMDPEIDPESVEFPPMLIQPIVENAIHYGLLTKMGERNLLVHFFEAGNQLVCRIEDNGVGVISHRRTSIKNPERASKGTNLISDRIALLNQAYSLNGSLQIMDISEIEPGKTGTRVELSFDLHKLEV